MCILVHVRTNIVIDEELLGAAMRAAGTKTKRATVECALREMVSRRRRLDALELGKIGWSGDLAALRRDRDLG